MKINDTLQSIELKKQGKPVAMNKDEVALKA